MKSIISHLHITRISAFAKQLATVMAAAMLATACTDDGIGTQPETDADCITLRLTNVTGAARADGDKIAGDNALNEQLISTAVVCLFTDNAKRDTDEPVFMQTYTINEIKQKELTIRLNSTLKKQLFPEGVATAYCYTIANLPATTTIPPHATLGQLRALGITADFATNQPQPSFVMDGDADITLGKDPVTNIEKVTGDVLLSRTAAKISLAVKVVSEVVEGDKTWYPMTDNMYTLITNGVNHTTVDPELYTVTDADYFKTTTNATNPNHRQRVLEESTVEGAEYPYVLKQPYYTYPNIWTAEDYNATMTYITLVVPWEDREGSYRRCYYMVPIVKDASVLSRNMYYQTRVNVNILGSFSPEEPTEIIDASYRAVDWGSAPVNVEIEDYRYLVLDNEYYTVNNEALINIPFYSSHETVVKSASVKYYLYNTTAAGLETEIPLTEAQNLNSTTDSVTSGCNHIYSRYVDNVIDKTTGARTLVFNHPLYQWSPKTSTGGDVTLGATTPGGTTYPNTTLQTRLNQISYYTRTPDAAYSRYEVEIVIVHKDKIGQPDEAQFTETVHITQYPAMFIEAVANNFITYQNQPYGVASYGNVYINNSNSGNSGAMVPSGLTGGNRNPNMYIVRITQLNNTRYIVGDPRTQNISVPAYGNNNTNWAQAPAIYNGATNRRLQYYYPTDDSDNKKMYIAPKLRIASSYGVSPTMNKTNAVRRCAGYQELDCPAGRWRLPSLGELEYIVNLSNTGKIPELFSADGTYWTAQGSIQASVTAGQLGTPGTGVGNVRCVYDEWYWGDSKVAKNGTKTVSMNRTNYTVDNYPFTWGDAPRTN